MVCIFTDLDGCLLDEDYSWKGAERSLEKIKKREIDLCIVTSKTFEEVVPYWNELDLNYPFAYENGGGIAAPPGFLDDIDEEKDGFELFYLGEEYEELRAVFKEVQKSVPSLKGFGDMDIQEVSDVTGLDTDRARKAKKRRHEEVFLPDDEAAVLLEKRGYRVVKGTRFYHVMDEVDKGTAVQYLLERLEPDVSLSIGDSENDYPMFKKTDRASLLGGKESIETNYGIEWEGIEIKEKKGPETWNEVVWDFLHDLDL